MCIIGRGWHGDTASAPCIYVTQLISELLKAVCCEVVIVVQNVIVCGSACSLRRNYFTPLLSKAKILIT